MIFQELLDELAEAARSNRDKGTQFEKLIANYLLTAPQYADRLADVWLWEEWPDRWSTDVGIDLVARERGTGEYWAIQCKFFDPSHYLQKADIDSFFTASGKKFATEEGERSCPPHRRLHHRQVEQACRRYLDMISPVYKGVGSRAGD